MSLKASDPRRVEQATPTGSASQEWVRITVE